VLTIGATDFSFDFIVEMLQCLRQIKCLCSMYTHADFHFHLLMYILYSYSPYHNSYNASVVRLFPVPVPAK